MKYDLVVIGGGPAGLAAAIEAFNNGLKDILIIERDKELGGILNQCIHNGFGLHYFKEELTGPEYAGKFIKMLEDTSIDVKLNTMVLSIENADSQSKQIHCVNKQDGYMIIDTKAIILAMGCRERNKGPIRMTGARGAGVFSAGSAQRYVNIDGYMVGKTVVILGSGDIGLIMARRMTLEGAQVKAVIEIMPHSNGLTRNIVQCLDDYNIPLYLSHTITDVIGNERVEKVVVSKVDDKMKPIKGTEIEFECDTVLLSVGLVPENELSKTANIEIDPRTNGAVVFENTQTNIEGVFACGNVLHVHDLVDFVTNESKRAGKSAAQYVLNKSAFCEDEKIITLKNGDDVSYTVPQKVRPCHVEKLVDVFFRVRSIHKNAQIIVKSGDNIVAKYKREHMAPGEMEKIVLPRKILDMCSDEITISVINI